MRVDPSIAALRSDRAPQRQAQAAMEAAMNAWRAETDAANALGEFERFGEGAALEDCPSLEAIFTGQGQAEALMQALVRHFCAAIAANPLGHPPFRNSFDGRASTLQLAKSGRAQILLQSREPGHYDCPTASFSENLRYDAHLAGHAKGRIVRISGPREQVHFGEEEVALQGGARLAFDCMSEMLLVEEVETRLVTLRLLQSAERPQPVREYCRDTGRLIHQAAGTLASSRCELMVAMLGRMDRADAAPVLAQVARREGEDGLRWQAMRECLALDTAEGFAALCAVARDPNDSLSDTAGALRAQLVEQHPQLARLENA
ncbi:hypothetical protein [Alteraurantiacibacter aquimixticola]|uniref:HEAT repeat domain-containing protein n=1 Tax=Alteraurantiacibacter aquimixticola TaxID=2489173 RepID=A0A4T3F0V8_9SPHN|nr:hypothetical protein [Alteraurantiacibacter aquimixticola]TIX50584.1 hypothetical protein E5222_09980 [Alteraurantiacibacter aquimixticola]